MLRIGADQSTRKTSLIQATMSNGPIVRVGTGGIVKNLISFVTITMLMCLTGGSLPAWSADTPARVTIIYDAFGKPSNLWGYLALIE